MATNEAPKKENRFPVFKKRFNELRGDMPQHAFAEKIGIARATVGFYENGVRLPDAETLHQICKACDCTSDWLLGLSDIRNPDIKIQGISKRTGLSAANIELLEQLLRDDEAMIWTINEIFECESFLEFVASFEQYKIKCLLATLVEQRGFRDKFRLQLGIAAKRLDEFTPEQRAKIEELIATHGILEKGTDNIVFDFDTNKWVNVPSYYQKPSVSMSPDEAREAALWRIGRVAERLAEEYLESKE